jgi:hypothetical protein
MHDTYETRPKHVVLRGKHCSTVAASPLTIPAQFSLQAVWAHPNSPPSHRPPDLGTGEPETASPRCPGPAPTTNSTSDPCTDRSMASAIKLPSAHSPTRQVAMALGASARWRVFLARRAAQRARRLRPRRIHFLDRLERRSELHRCIYRILQRIGRHAWRSAGVVLHRQGLAHRHSGWGGGALGGCCRQARE